MLCVLNSLFAHFVCLYTSFTPPHAVTQRLLVETRVTRSNCSCGASLWLISSVGEVKEEFILMQFIVSSESCAKVWVSNTKRLNKLNFIHCFVFIPIVFTKPQRQRTFTTLGSHATIIYSWWQNKHKQTQNVKLIWYQNLHKSIDALGHAVLNAVWSAFKMLLALW